MIKKSIYFFIFILFYTGCASLSQKKQSVPQKRIEQNIKIRIDKIIEIKGIIKFSPNTPFFLRYNNGNFSVYKGTELIFSKFIGDKAGNFEWSNEGIFFIKFTNFIKKGNWLNSGELYFWNKKNKKIEKVLDENNISFFSTSGNKIVFIKLGSVYIFEKHKDKKIIKKIINGNSIISFLVGNILTVYKRDIDDKLLFINIKNNKVLESVILKKNVNRWVPNYYIECKNNKIFVYTEKKVRCFLVDKNITEINKLKGNEINKNFISIGKSTIRVFDKNEKKYFYLENGNKRIFLYKIDDTISLSFFRITPYIFYRTLDGMLVFKYSFE